MPKEKCTMCDKLVDIDEITVIDDVNRVCEFCRDNEYIQCDECNEYWLWDAIKFYEMKDGRTLCEHCAEDIEDESEIDHINNWTGLP